MKFTKIIKLLIHLALFLFIVLPLLAALISASIDFRKLRFWDDLETKAPFQTTNISQAPFIENDPAITNGWKTYINQQEGYSIKYPGNLFIEEDTGTGALNVTFSNVPFDSGPRDEGVVKNTIRDYSSAKESMLSIDISLPYDETDLENDVEHRFSENLRLQKIMINSNEAVYVDGGVKNVGGVGESRIGYYYLRAENGNVYSIGVYIGTADEKNEEIFNLMLSTFTIL